MHRFWTISAFLFALAGTASAETGESETAGRFLMSIPVRGMDPVIDYCSESVPEIRNDLLEEKSVFADKFTEAMKPLMDKFKDDPEFNAPVEERMRQGIADVNAHGLSIIKQQDADTTCRKILANIQSATVDGLRKVIEDTYQKFRAATPVQESPQP